MQCATDLLICKNEDLCPDIWGIDTFLTPDCNEAVNRWHLTFLLTLMEWPLVKRYIALGLSHWDNSLSKNKFEIFLCGPLIQEPHLSAQFHRIQSVDRVEKKKIWMGNPGDWNSFHLEEIEEGRREEAFDWFRIDLSVASHKAGPDWNVWNVLSP